MYEGGESEQKDDEPNGDEDKGANGISNLLGNMPQMRMGVQPNGYSNGIQGMGYQQNAPYGNQGYGHPSMMGMQGQMMQQQDVGNMMQNDLPATANKQKWQRNYDLLTDKDRQEMLVDEIFALYLYRMSNRIN